MRKNHPVITFLGGILLFAWERLWTFVSSISTVDFVRTAGGHPGIATFFLPKSFAEMVTFLGLGLMGWAFVQLWTSRNASQHIPEPDPMPRNDSQASMKAFGGSVSLLRSSGTGGARMLTASTSATGEQELNLGIRPTKILFEEPCKIVDESGFGTELKVNGKRLAVRRFTEKGLVVDDYGEKIPLRIYVLDGSPTPPQQS